MPITSVRSAHGHQFASTDSAGMDSCMVCGALYALVPDSDDATSGQYLAANGDPAQRCTGDTSMSHGYPGERGPDGNTDHDCNCLSCR